MWMTPRKMARKPGTPGRIVVAADVSGSMYTHLGTAAEEFAVLSKTLPDFILAVFAERAAQTTSAKFAKIAAGKLIKEVNDHLGGGTDIPDALEYVASLNPQTTIIISDGLMNSAAHKGPCLSIAERMTGSIFTFLCGPEDHFGLMAELARIGNGRCTHLDGRPETFRSALREALKSHKEEDVMARIEKPDYVIESDQFTFVAPENEQHDLRKRIEVLTGTIVDVHHCEPEIRHHGQATQQRFVVEQNRSQIEKPQSIFRTVLGSLFSAPQLDAPEVSYRGRLREAPAISASAKPLALPAPSSVPAIPDQRPIDFATGSRVPAVFRR